jgi:ferric-dicitrate binding protein FerR (iron transport regulator)
MSAFDDLPEADQRLARSLQSTLRASEELDYVTAARLRAARARALAPLPHPMRNWLYASGGLTAAVLVAVLVLWRQPLADAPVAADIAGGQADVLDVLTDEVDADFYDDLDLYRWLDRSQDGRA